MKYNFSYASRRWLIRHLIHFYRPLMHLMLDAKDTVALGKRDPKITLYLWYFCAFGPFPSFMPIWFSLR